LFFSKEERYIHDACKDRRDDQNRHEICRMVDHLPPVLRGFPVAPHIDRQTKCIRLRKGIQHQRKHHGAELLQLTDDPASREVPAGELSLIDPDTLSLQSRDKPNRDQEHQSIIARDPQRIEGIHQITRLGRDDQQLEREDQHRKPESHLHREHDRARRHREHPVRQKRKQHIARRTRKDRQNDQSKTQNDQQRDLTDQRLQQPADRRESQHENDHPAQKQRIRREDRRKHHTDREEDLRHRRQPVNEPVPRDILHNIFHFTHLRGPRLFYPLPSR